MKGRIPAVMAGLLTGAVALAAKPLLPVDSPAAASRALAVTFNVQEGVRFPWRQMIDEARSVVSPALSMLSARATPAQVMEGVTLACPLSGTLTATLARLPIRTVFITWNDCASLSGDHVLTVSGSGELVPGNDSLNPGWLRFLKLGQPGKPVVAARRYLYAPETEREEQLFALGAIGRIPTVFDAGQFAYVLDGQMEWNVVSADPLASSRRINTARNLVVSGSTTRPQGGDVIDEDLTLSGSSRSVYIPGMSPPELQLRFTARNFRVHRISRDVTPYFDTLTVDGDIDYLWTPGGVGGCGDGRYSFRTLVPIKHGLGGTRQSFEQGQIVLNGTATATFSPGDGPAPPEWYVPEPDERPTLVTIDLGSAGVYEHTSFAPIETLPIYDGCDE